MNTVSCMLYRYSVIPPMDQGCTLLYILLIYGFWMSHTLTLCVLALGDECVSLSIYALFRQWNIFRNFHSKVFSCMNNNYCFDIYATPQALIPRISILHLCSPSDGLQPELLQVNVDL